ncbi:SDR family NAD(P)-dependent oxidoreductase [Clostridium tarantellae]|uniref:SDR family NAD(P)-dependent oxidoreductase n=1 Tax=Clostridium tarantellae TaxID=39493 RepID=A0A6I1MKG9_9CLOT|nr:SDR family oxidoreductase [Clostridium tarantellae]MPQ42682.1 SDR family NAD(P)-dependent oxidoreductase [Clostridium tarantellae]
MKDKLAIITGGTSGIGKEFANQLAEKGYNILITGRRIKELEKVAEEIRNKTKVNVETYIIDLAIDNEVEEFMIYLEKKNNIEFLVNNAGHGAEKSFTDDKYENQLEMINLHIIATVKLCHGLIKIMKKNKKGYIVNVSSVAAFNTFPSSAMYCSTKAFLINFSQSLAMEVKKYHIKVQGLCPGFTRTHFHSRLKMDENILKNKGLIRWMTTNKVVNISLNNIEKDLKVIVIPGISNKFIYHLNKFIPKSIYYKFAIKGWELME